jgi:hypothetical protein
MLILQHDQVSICTLLNTTTSQFFLTMRGRSAVARALETAGELVQRSRLQPPERRLRGLGEASLLVEGVRPALADMDAPVELLGVLQQTLQAIAEASQVSHH